MAKKKKTEVELDSVYFLKLVMYVIVSSFWIKITKGDSFQLPLPIGPLVALFFASHEHFQIDRKIEYALIIVAALVGFWAPLGLYIYL